MRLRLAVAVAVFSFLAVSQAIAQVGIAVENIRVENGGDFAFVRVVNQSAKDVTAFNLTVNFVYSDGRADYFEHGTDFLNQIISTGSGALHPGDSYEVRLDFAHKITSVTAKPDAVVYADLTSETAGNPDALDRIASQRKSSAAAAFKAAQIINEAAANDVTPDPTGMALRQLRLLADQAKQSADMGGIELQNIISDLENKARAESHHDIDISTRRESLRQYATQKSKDAETQSAHSLFRRAR